MSKSCTVAGGVIICILSGICGIHCYNCGATVCIILFAIPRYILYISFLHALPMFF